MGSFIKGDVVTVPFPFSDPYLQPKKRPALVITKLSGDDVILCMITSQPRSDNYIITLLNNDFSSGSINKDSYIRTNRLFTADSNIIIDKKGSVKKQKIDEVIDKIIKIIRS